MSLWIKAGKTRVGDGADPTRRRRPLLRRLAGSTAVLVRVPVLTLGVILPFTGSTVVSASSGVAYHFSAAPIASAGSIGPGRSLTFVLRVTNNGAPYPGGHVYLGYFQGGHVSGDSTAVPSSQCSASQLPSPGSFVLCSADSKGNVALTYTAPAQLPAQGRADWVGTANPSTTHGAVTHYVYTAVYRFSPSPIAPSGRLGAGATVPITLTAKDGLNNPVPNDTVYLSFSRASGGGSAKVGSTQLTATPVLFTTGSNGALPLTYTAPSSLPSNGQDAVVVQDLRNSPNETNSDSYAFSTSAPVVSVGDVTVVEGDQDPGIPADFTVTISPLQAHAVTVQYVTLCGIGDKGCGEDFVQVFKPVTVTIPANTSSTTILVRQFAYVGGNTGETYNEGWYVKLSNPNVGVLGRSVGNGMLLPDVEGSTTALALLYTGSAGVVPCTDAGGVPLFLTVTLGAQERTAVTFHYQTADGTAIAGTDYTAVSGTATIPAGKTSVVIRVTLLAKLPPANDKTFTLTISNPTGGPTISRATGIGTVMAG